MTSITELAQDHGYRWRDDETDTMSKEELWSFLLSEASSMDMQGEVDSVYHIYREVIWRFPDKEGAWKGFALAAASMGYKDEYEIAMKHAHHLGSNE